MGDSVADVRRFLDQWIRAERRGDVTTLRGLLDDDFFALQPGGSITDKIEWLQRYQKATLVHDRLDLSIVLQVEHRHFAVIVGRLWHVSSCRGRAVSGIDAVTIVLGLDPDPRLLALHIAEAVR